VIEYDETDLFPFPRDELWRLLTAHMDDDLIHQIHPLVRTQRTVSVDGDSKEVERSIDVLGRARNSRWRITLRAPDFSKYEILTSEGPWVPGSSVENHYLDAAGGTQILSHIKLQIKGLPFFLSQKRTSSRALAMIDREDRAFLSRPR
jgi:hypothetical protein